MLRTSFPSVFQALHRSEQIRLIRIVAWQEQRLADQLNDLRFAH